MKTYLIITAIVLAICAGTGWWVYDLHASLQQAEKSLKESHDAAIISEGTIKALQAEKRLSDSAIRQLKQSRLDNEKKTNTRNEWIAVEGKKEENSHIAAPVIRQTIDLIQDDRQHRRNGK